MAECKQFVVLLRGINVGGHNRVPMTELRDALDRAGFEAVRTYIQSGNVLLDGGGRAEAAVVSDVEAVMADRFQLPTPVVARPVEQWSGILAANPFPEAVSEPKFLHVSLCDRAPAAAAVDRFDAGRYAPDHVAVAGRQLYLWYPNGSGRSKLTGAVLERALAVTTTARNWSTMLKLDDLIAAG